MEATSRIDNKDKEREHEHDANRSNHHSDYRSDGIAGDQRRDVVMTAQKSFIERHFDGLGVLYRLHSQISIETWLREYPNGVKVGVVWYSKSGDTWQPERAFADPVKEL